MEGKRGKWREESIKGGGGGDGAAVSVSEV